MPNPPDLSDAAGCSSGSGNTPVIDRICITVDDAKNLVKWSTAVNEVELALQGCNLVTRPK